MSNQCARLSKRIAPRRTKHEVGIVMRAVWIHAHLNSERFAAKAEILHRKGIEDYAKYLYRRAAKLEFVAFEGIGPDKTRTKGIIGVSAVCLWLKSGDLEISEVLAQSMLMDESMPEFIIDDLCDILLTIQNRKEQEANLKSDT